MLYIFLCWLSSGGYRAYLRVYLYKSRCVCVVVFLALCKLYVIWQFHSNQESWRSCSSNVVWCDDAASRIHFHSNSSETVTRENADASTGVLEVVDYNSESFYLNEDDDVSPSIFSCTPCTWLYRGQLVLAWRMGLLNGRLHSLYRQHNRGFAV